MMVTSSSSCVHNPLMIDWQVTVPDPVMRTAGGWLLMVKTP
jgi:hypothetical protein